MFNILTEIGTMATNRNALDKEDGHGVIAEGRVRETNGSSTGEQLCEQDVRRGFVVEGRVVNIDGSSKGDQLGKHDVILGRGLGTYNHIGNVEFRKLVNKHKMRYLACSKVDKPKVARELVQIWKKLDPPGRFLQRAEGESKLDWIEVCDKKAQEKASQCLRERTPDVLPYYEVVRDRKRKATGIKDPAELLENSPTQMKKRLRLDLAASSGLTPLVASEIPGMLTSDVSLSALYSGDHPAVHAALQKYYEHNATDFLLKHEIERKVALRRLLLQQQLHTPHIHNLSLESILGFIPVRSNAATNPINYGVWL